MEYLTQLTEFVFLLRDITPLFLISVRIGKKCLIGGATVVKRNVSDFSVVKTPNDTMIIKQYPEDVIESKWQAHHNIR